MNKAWQTGERGGRFYLTKTGEKKYGKEAQEAARAEGMKALAAPRPDVALGKLAAARKGLGIPRAEMPQIRSYDVKEFVDSLKEKGIDVDKKKIRAGKLKPTQLELNPEKVAALKGKPSAADKRIIVSNDGFIMDGHHRWAGVLADDPDNKIRAYKVDLPMKELLKEARAFPKATKQDIKEAGRTGGEKAGLSEPIHPGPGPVLSRKEAEKFAAGSELKGAFFRGTTHPDDGAFIPQTSDTLSLLGRGVYMTEDKPTDREYGAPQELRVKVDNPIDYYGEDAAAIKESKEYKQAQKAIQAHNDKESLGNWESEDAAAFQVVAQRRGHDAVFFNSVQDDPKTGKEVPAGKVLCVWDARKVAVVDTGKKQGVVKAEYKRSTVGRGLD